MPSIELLMLISALLVLPSLPLILAALFMDQSRPAAHYVRGIGFGLFVISDIADFLRLVLYGTWVTGFQVSFGMSPTAYWTIRIAMTALFVFMVATSFATARELKK